MYMCKLILRWIIFIIVIIIIFIRMFWELDMNFLNKSNKCFVYGVVRKMTWIIFIRIYVFIGRECCVNFRVYVNLVSLVIIVWIIRKVNFLLVCYSIVIYWVYSFIISVVFIEN